MLGFVGVFEDEQKGSLTRPPIFTGTNSVAFSKTYLSVEQSSVFFAGVEAVIILVGLKGNLLDPFRTNLGSS